MPGHVGDLDQVRAPLHRTRYESGAEAMTSECRGVEAETGSTLLHDRCDIPRRQAPIGDPLGPLVEDPAEYGALGDASGVQPHPESCHGARYLASPHGPKTRTGRQRPRSIPRFSDVSASTGFYRRRCRVRRSDPDRGRFRRSLFRVATLRDAARPAALPLTVPRLGDQFDHRDGRRSPSPQGPVNRHGGVMFADRRSLLPQASRDHPTAVDRRSPIRWQP
jgi:hypothetical protein